MKHSIYQPVIGIEVHCQLLTQSKAFCSVSIDQAHNSVANTHVGPTSAGLPGTLPSLNKEAVELAIRAGLALDCHIQRKSVFARKHYFYPDLPKGYQISQFSEPICTEGFVEYSVGSNQKKVRIERIHIEEDAGKLSHGFGHAMVDLNRAGVPLIEIVSHADMSSVDEAVLYVRCLYERLLYSKVTDGNLEAGNFRADINVSIKKKEDSKWGTRTELKNINSFKFIEAALDFEIHRQIAIIDAGGKITQETRGWDEASKTTYSLRSKENAPDYRYFPDPDLPPLLLDDKDIQRIQNESPELPNSIRLRFLKLGISVADVERFLADPDYVRYIDACFKLGGLPLELSNWFFSELLRECHQNGLSPTRCPVTPTKLTELVNLINQGKISGKIAKTLFKKMWVSPEGPTDIALKEGLLVESNPAQINQWISEVLAKNPAIVEEYRSGKTKVMDFLLGQVMKISKGKADPTSTRDLMQKALVQTLDT